MLGWGERGAGGGSRLVALCSLANFINAADRVIMPVAIVGLAREHGYTLAQQGWVLSAFPAGYISSQVVGTCAGRQFGSWRLLLFVVLMWSLATLLTPLVAASLHLLILTRVILGVGEGLGLPTIYTLFADTVTPEHRSRAFGYLAAAGSVGQTVAAFVSPHLHWELPFFVCGCLGLLWCVAWFSAKEEAGPALPNQVPKQASVLDQVKIMQQAVNPMRQWKQLLTSGPLVAIYAAHFAMNWTSYIIMHWLPTYLSAVLRADPHGLSLAALPYIANSVASIGVGHLADALVNRRGVSVVGVRRLLTGLGLILPAFFLFAFAAIQHLYIAILLVSLSMGTLALNAAGHLSNHADVAPRLAGVTFAISNTIATLPGLLVGPLTANLVLEASGRWWPVFILAGMVNLVGAVFYVGHAKAVQVI